MAISARAPVAKERRSFSPLVRQRMSLPTWLDVPTPCYAPQLGADDTTLGAASLGVGGAGTVVGLLQAAVGLRHDYALLN